MATTYASPSTLAHTAIDGMSSGAWAGTPAFDNTSNNYDDAIVAGQVDGGATVVDNEKILIFILPILPDNATTGQFVKGVVDGGFSGADATLVESSGATQDIKQENLGTAAITIRVDSTANKPYEFAFGVRQILGYMPPKFALVVWNSTANTLGSDNDFEVTGITHS